MSHPIRAVVLACLAVTPAPASGIVVEPPYIVSVRFTLAELDALAQPQRGGRTVQAPASETATITVTDTDGLRRALAGAGPGTTIRIAPGTYRGGISARGLRGEPGRPIILAVADPDRPPIFEG